MNNYELICQYCGNSWKIPYLPSRSQVVRCNVCHDLNIKYVEIKLDIINQYVEKSVAELKFIDQYIGCPPFPPKQEKKKEEPKEEPKKEEPYLSYDQWRFNWSLD